MYLPHLKLDHVAIAVTSLEPYNLNNIETISDQDVRVGFIENLEIISPISENSSVARFIQKHGSGTLHHVGFKVDDIIASISDLKSKGVQMIDNAPRLGARGKKIAFIHPKSTGGTLIELCE